MNFKTIFFVSFFTLLGLSTAFSDDEVIQFQEDIITIKKWAHQQNVIDAILQQNKKHSSFKTPDILNLDKRWRLKDGALRKQIMQNELSVYLANIMVSSDGHYTEIFVMDNKGLNVGQSTITSDLWQGDEAKWREVFPKGPNAIHISDLEKDNSTRSFQTQISLPIVFEGKNIGVVTVGISDEKFN